MTQSESKLVYVVELQPKYFLRYLGRYPYEGTRKLSEAWRWRVLESAARKAQYMRNEREHCYPSKGARVIVVSIEKSFTVMVKE